MDIYIKREKNITLQEWVDYVKKDRELILAESAEAINPITRQKLKIEIPGRALLGDNEIVYRKGCIGCDDYSEVVVAKLKEIAKVFNAEIFA